MSTLITSHVTVDAPAADVWATLTDLPGHARWNPFITAAAGTLDVGHRLRLTIQPPGSRAMTFRPWVTAVDRHRYLEWLGHVAVPGLFDGRHSFTLTPIDGGPTLLQQAETFTGLATPFARPVLARTREGFVAMNRALADHLDP